MKKFILFSLLIICFTRSYAQKESIRFGFFGGLNQSYFTNQPRTLDGFQQPEEIGLLGIHLGVIGQKTLSSHFSTNVLFGASQKGTKFKPSSGFQNTYLNLATHIRFDYKKFFVETGPEVGFLLDSKVLNQEGKFVSLPSFIKIFDQKFDFLGNAGIGAWITKSTSLSLRVSKGFLNTIKEATLTDDNGAPIATGSFFKNLTYQISVCQLVF